LDDSEHQLLFTIVLKWYSIYRISESPNSKFVTLPRLAAQLFGVFIEVNKNKTKDRERERERERER